MRSKAITIAALGAAQILGWGTSFYFPAVLAPPIVADTGWSLGWVVSGTTLGLLVAGLMAPRVGAFIDRHGGRPSLAASSLLFSAGLACIGLAPSLPVFLFGWVVVGLGMGTGLYDAAFATLGKLYGSDARMPITNLTLIGGFASTVCWPLSAFLAEAFGWRGACFVYAVLHLAVSLPLQMAVVPSLARSAGGFDATSDTSGRTPAIAPRQRLPFVLLALVLTLASGIGSIVIVHFMIFLQARGADLALAVALGTLFGPSQVGARIVERLFGSRYHPIWTMVASCVLMALGIGMLSGGFPWLVLTILVYGGGYGIMWIARGTLPLALFGAERYATLMGRLAFPALVVQALAPSAGAWAVERHGAESVMEWLTALAVVNVVLILLLWAWRRRPADRI
jgi:predicted MFS family arabinose efflux permease